MTPTEILARTLHVEAGGCALRGIEALAVLVLRRARMALACDEARLRFAQGAPAGGEAAMVAAVCRAPFQFGCWRPGGPAWDVAGEDAHLAMCHRVAVRALAGSLPDMAPGATHWHDARSLPAWAIGRMPLAETGGLALYRLAA